MNETRNGARLRPTVKVTTRRLQWTGSVWLDLDSGRIFNTTAAAKRSVKRESKRNAAGGLGAVNVEWSNTNGAA